MNSLMLIFPGGIGFGEILVVFAIILLLFGATKVPALMRSLGSGIKEFKDAAKDDDPNKNDSDDKSLKSDNK
jgi:sec-independent protein translocase protein TatA